MKLQQFTVSTHSAIAIRNDFLHNRIHEEFADFPLFQFSISKLFWLIFFFVLFLEKQFVVEEYYKWRKQPERFISNWFRDKSRHHFPYLWISRCGKFNNILLQHKNLFSSSTQKFETLWKIIQIFYFTRKRRTKNSSWKTFFFVLNFLTFIFRWVFFVFPQRRKNSEEVDKGIRKFPARSYHENSLSCYENPINQSDSVYIITLFVSFFFFFHLTSFLSPSLHSLWFIA